MSESSVVLTLKDAVTKRLKDISNACKGFDKAAEEAHG